jgi:hypothetical protein
LIPDRRPEETADHASVAAARVVADTRVMAPEAGGVAARVASTDADLDAVTETISLAFHDDPTWSWAFPDASRRQEQYAVFWRLLIAGAMRYPWVLLTERCEAAAVWIPPGGTEIPAEDEKRVEPLVQDLVGPRAGEVLELLERFDAAHPRHEPHYYSLLSVDLARIRVCDVSGGTHRTARPTTPGHARSVYELYSYKQWLRVYMRSKMIKHNKDLFESIDEPLALLDKLHIY